jgi:hypothetical protein
VHKKFHKKCTWLGPDERPQIGSKNSLTAAEKTFAMAFTRHAPSNALQLKQNFEPTKMGRAAL